MARSSPPRPLVTLPRGVPDEEAQVRIFVELARAPAGCFICDRPIPKGVSRFSIVIRLPEPVVNQRTGQTRVNERYNAHSGCLGKAITGSEVLRTRDSCYDCGFEREPEPEERSDGGATFTQADRLWTNWCFTTSKFAPAPLCDRCVDKPKWAQCPVCTIWFPPYMIHTVAGDDEDMSPDWTQLDNPRRQVHMEAGGRACGPCCARWGWVTIDEAASAKDEFDRLRQEILEKGVFEAGDDL